MLNNFIYAQSKAMFEERLHEVPNDAIVFIEDTKEIWTHGHYFDGSTLDPSIIPNLQMEVAELRANVNDKADVDGSYPDMTVGFAEDLGGAEFTQESEFTIRATANGEFVKDGAARIESIKGNSMVWNQQNDHYLTEYVKTWLALNGNSYSVTTETDQTEWIAISKSKVWIAGHYYYFNLNVTGSPTSGFYMNAADKTVKPNTPLIVQISSASTSAPSLRLEAGNVGVTFSFQAIDLTQMFGSGNEPTTIEEFYARIPMGVDLNAYNEGEVISMKAIGIKSVGRNQWNEQWELGGINSSDGKDFDATNRIKSGYIRILANTKYYFKKPQGIFTLLYFYDENKNFVGYLDPFVTSGVGGIFTTMDAPYMRFMVAQDTYHHDICLNLSDTDFNGQYEPYIEDSEDLSIVRKYFPNGMRSAGSAHDEIRYNKATNRWEKVVRIGEVDMGGLTWQMLSDGETRRFSVDTQYLSTMKVPNSNSDNNIVLCSLYPCSTFTNIASKDRVIMPTIYSNEIISIKDLSYTSAESFKAAMSGAMLYYELATPIITEIEDPGFSYQV